MNVDVFHKKLLPKSYAGDISEIQRSRRREIDLLFTQCKWPNDGWPNDLIEQLIAELSQLDSNNFQKKVGVGEREGRVYSDLVSRRHYNFSHGIGRSGNLNEAQPKAIGSTILNNLTNALLLDVLHKLGLRNMQKCCLVPMATGMTLMLALLHLKSLRPPSAKYVLWSRIDQKSCLKCILTAGLVPIIVNTRRDSDGQLVTDIEEFQRQITNHGTENLVCIYSTTSCFAPRAVDNVIELAKVAATAGIPHLTNNAYGLQSTYSVHQIETASRVGRLDLCVQSTDKNFMVPVGGAIVATPNSDDTMERFTKSYPGRASSSQTLDILITLLAMGERGYKQLLDERIGNFNYLRERVQNTIESRPGVQIINAKGNRISIAIAMPQLSDVKIRELGSKLFTRHVMGARAVPSKQSFSIEGLQFHSWGNHTDDEMPPYLTVASAIGMKRVEVDIFVGKLNKVLQEMM